MEDSTQPLPPCKCCSPPDEGSEAKKHKQACCDTTCLEIAAQQECNMQCHDNDATNEIPEDVSTTPKTGCCSSKMRTESVKKPCKKHLKAAHERYATTLEAIGCICKALIARNLESCCSSIRNRKTRSSGDATLKARTSDSGLLGSKLSGCAETTRANVAQCGEKTAYCESNEDAGGKRPGCQGETAKISKSELDACGAKNDCCELAIESYGKRSTVQGASPQISRYNQKGEPCIRVASRDEPTSCCQDVCCTKPERRNEAMKPNVTPASGLHDIEKGSLVLEHVTLNVEGLTCVGCENKLFRSLDAIPGIHNLQTSLVMSQAEFDIDANTDSVSKVIREVTKATGFACQRANSQGQSLEVLVSGDAREFINQKRPYGVEEMTAMDKQTVRITYDARLIGARDLLEKAFSAVTTLAPPRSYPNFETGSRHVRKTAYMTAFSAALTIPVLTLAWAPLPQYQTLYGAISLALATIVQIVVAGPFYPSALRALLFTHVIEMDLLIVLSTSTAYSYSVIAFAYQVLGQPLSTGEFFETSTLLVTLIMVGRLVSAFARQKAVESISIRSLQIETALLVDCDGLGGQEIDARLLQYGDRFKTMPDSRIATDGIVISGESEVDESSVTGEAVPVAKLAGSNVIAGCLNGPGVLVVRVTRLPGENTISQIACMVDAAKFSKPKIQHLADRVASYFVPVILIFTLIAFAIWIAVGITIQQQSSGSAAVRAMTYAISVLIVSCPCAIGLAVPMVIVIAGGVGAKHGVIFKSAETIEIARNVSHVVFDKTGTLTKGELSVSAEEYFSESPSFAASLALGLTVNSKHPVSAAVVAYLQAQCVEHLPVQDVKSVTGSGIEGTWDGISVRGGNSRWLAIQSTRRVASLLSQGRTVFCVSLGDELLAAYGLDDTLRPDAKSVVSSLQKHSITVSLVSGDDDGAVQKFGRELGIPSSQIRPRCSPVDKQKYVKALMGHKDSVVVFCGDGTNDAVALAQASIGLHMNSGTDIAQSAADAVLVRPALEGILVLIDLSRAAFRRILFNFGWSLVYNTFAILLAAGAFVHARIPPQYAGLGELVSVLPVILIALQLRWFRTG